ncbi:MAG: hypothetical protein LUH45_00975, partial [Clostridiales bacterium]|nr:hypothetical protein [Clostridiales bacterium]
IGERIFIFFHQILVCGHPHDSYSAFLHLMSLPPRLIVLFHYNSFGGSKQGVTALETRNTANELL